MKLKLLFRYRPVVMLLIIGTLATMIVFYLLLGEYWHKGHKYVSGLNLTFPDVSWLNLDTNPSNESRPLEDNFRTAPRDDDFLFLKWQSNVDRDVNVSEKLIQSSDKVKVSGINCNAMFSGLTRDQAKAQTKANQTDIPLTNQVYVNLTADCERFQTSRGYIMSSLTQEEEDFPLAFSMLVYKDLEMVERLLRAIYRPQNYYCIHVDQKASADFYNATSAIAKCFPNVFIASQRISVWWSTISVLQPELLCMQELWKYRKWKYFINLTGQEFPLKTNLELVKILTAFRGASDVHSTFKCAEKKRWMNTTPPHGLRPAKGSVHIAVNRIFVDYILHNQTAQDLLNWTSYTKIPDETFFATLYSNPQLGIKGTYKGWWDGCKGRPIIARYKSWRRARAPCANKFVRFICILSTGDLQRLGQAKEMFANKFFLNEDRTVIGCLEEKVFNDTRDEYLGLKTFDSSYYSNLEFVVNQVT